MSTVPRGIDPEPLSAWLAEHLPGSSPPYEWDLVAAGASNLSYVLSDARARRWIMRRGPVSARLSRAHDMGREWRVLSALAAVQEVPVPSCIAYCDDPGVNGSDFYVMELVEGRILRSSDDAADMSAARCERVAHSLVDVQAAIHRVDIAKVGLSDLSKTHDKYVQRQLHRWHKQVQSSSSDEPPPLLTKLWEELLARDPGEQAPPALVHGDYRLDNVVLNGEDRVAGVLDWELSAIGDPVADFYWSLLYWTKKKDEVHFLPESPSLHDGFPGRREILAWYRKQSGFDLSAEHYFVAFGYWKMACIVNGVYHRLRKGASGGMKTGDLNSISAMVEAYLQAAQKAMHAF